MRDSATRDLRGGQRWLARQSSSFPYLCPPESSERLSFHTPPKATFTSRPSRTVRPSGGESLALVPGRRVEKMEPKSWEGGREGKKVS